MSNCSSQPDVIRTRIPTYAAVDNTVLYAYEPNTAYFNDQENAPSEVPRQEEEQRTILDVLTYCQVIYESVQNLDKKLDVVHGKVMKIQRFRAKSFWPYRKPLGFAGMNCNYVVPKKLKTQKMKKEQLQDSFSYPESCSPTYPVGRPENDRDSSFVGTPVHSDEEYERVLPDAAIEETPIVREDLPIPVSPGSAFQPGSPVQGTPPSPRHRPCFDSPDKYGSMSPTIPCRRADRDSLSQEEHSLGDDLDVKCYDSDDRPLDLSPTVPYDSATSSPIEPSPGVLRQAFPEKTSDWSVDDVILFLRCTDLQISDALVELFKEQEIDGKALLLLTNDMMITHLGVKLGMALKMRYYIEKLRRDKFFRR